MRRTFDHEYRTDFFAYTAIGSSRSAAIIIPILEELAPVRTVIDIGCGHGVWLAEWSRRLGSRDIVGVDGDYVDRSKLLIPCDRFLSANIAHSLQLHRRFDIVTCLEVAEHLPPENAATLIGNLTRHGDIIFFSAAVPGQGGEHHVNERPLEYWRTMFYAEGYRCYDPVRPRIVGDRRVDSWYRCNTLLYVNAAGATRLAPWAADTVISDGTIIKDVSSPARRLRNSVIRLFPVPLVTRLATARARWIARARH